MEWTFYVKTTLEVDKIFSSFYDSIVSQKYLVNFTILWKRSVLNIWQLLNNKSWMRKWYAFNIRHRLKRRPSEQCSGWNVTHIHLVSARPKERWSFSHFLIDFPYSGRYSRYFTFWPDILIGSWGFEIEHKEAKKSLICLKGKAN